MLAIILVPQDQPSIQAGIDAAQDGDAVLVAPGTYFEQLTIQNKAITLASQFFTTGDKSFIGQTIIDGGNNTVITLLPSAGVGTQIIGFTIQNGGDGISAAAVVDIMHNRFAGHSDAIDFEGGGGIVRDNVFERNSDDAIDLDGPTWAVIENNIIRDQGDDGIEIRLHNYTGPTLNVVIRNNQISGSGQDGIQIIEQYGAPERFFLIERNLIQGSGSAGLGLMNSGDTLEDFRAASIMDPIHLLNNTFLDNPHAVSGGDNMVVLNNLFVNSSTLGIKNVDGNSIVSHNLFWNNGIDYVGSNVDVTTSVFADPLLTDDYQLQFGSPGIDAGTGYFQWNGDVVLELPASVYSLATPDLGRFESVDDSILHFAYSVTATLPGGLNVASEDIIGFDGTSYRMIFDGSDLGLDTMRLDAIKVIDHDEILMSFASSGPLPGISEAVDDSDIVKFIATRLGDTTAGTFAMYLDGSDVGLDEASEDVDAVSLLDDGRVLISTTGDFSVPQLSGTQADIIAFTPTSLGDATAGSWSLHFDGSAVGLGDAGINGIDTDATGAIYLSTRGSFSTADLSGKDEDVFVFHPSSLGATTAGTFDPNLLFDGSISGAGADVTAIDIPGTHAMVTIQDVTGSEGTGLVFTVSLDHAVPSAFDVTVAFTDISATGGSLPLSSPADYADNPVTLHFAGTAGETQQFFVAALDDPLVEGSETFAVNLSTTSPLVNVSDTATGMITDNDQAGHTFETRVSASSDDAEERLSSGRMSLVSADLDMVYDSAGSGQDNMVGVRFTGVAVPHRATIQNAYIQFQADEPGSVATSLLIQGEDADDAQTFSSTNANITSRPTTASAVTWSPAEWSTIGEAGLDQQTPDLAAVIQEIINRPGWSSGNALAFTITGMGERVAESYDGTQIGAPLLHVEYDNATPGVTVSGQVDLAEGSLTDSYVVVLDSVPTADVDICVTPDSQTDLGAGPGMAIVLTFTPETARTPQTVSVTAVDDAAVEGPHISTITHAAASTDAGYSGIPISPVSATIADNDTPAETVLYLSLHHDVTMPDGLEVANEDVLAFDGTNLSFFFDGSDVGIGGTNIDALSVISANEVLLSFASPEAIPGVVGTVEDSDIVKFTATQLGDTTSGTFERFFTGGNVGLSPAAEDIDAVDLHPDGRLIISTIGDFDVIGVTGRDEDLIAFTPDIPGDYSAGTWELYVDGSDVEMAGEDIDAVALEMNGNIHLSATNVFAITGISGDDDDVFTFMPSQLGPESAGQYASTLRFDGSQFGLDASDVNAIDVPPPSALHVEWESGAASNGLNNAPRVTKEQADSLVAASMTLWAAVRGARLPAGTRLEVADLAGDLLGTAGQGVITLDVDAGGVGWFVDPTPLDNSEFPITSDVNSFLATSSSPAGGRFDLLTVVLHELGHLLGEDHSDPFEAPHSVMNASLGVGVRRTPVSSQDATRPEVNENVSLETQTGVDELFAEHAEWLAAVLIPDLTSPGSRLATKTMRAINQPMAFGSSLVPPPQDDRYQQSDRESMRRIAGSISRNDAAATDELFTQLDDSFELLDTIVLTLE